jgi:hypothetical protein
MRLNLRLLEGLNEYTPQKLAGILTEPAESEPNPNALLRVLTRTHYPPEDPPLTNSGLYGFLLYPKT